MEAVAWMSKAVRLGHGVAEVQFYEKAMGFILRPDRYTNSPPLALQHPGLVMEFKDTARLAFARAMAKGHPEAYLGMSRAVLEGLIYPRDPVLAYAYALRAETEGRNHRTIVGNAGYWKAAAAQYLDQEQIAEARHLALEMHAAPDD
jgi:TPR repeat protein